MKTVKFLEFLHSTKDLFTLDFATCDTSLLNFLDRLTLDEQFTQRIDLGIMYLYQKGLNQYIIVDGINRALSISLLLHAVCECYKKTSQKNDKAIKIIRAKYLLKDKKTKLHLAPEHQDIYNKILFGEKLSGKEKESPLFVLLHNFWVQIKEEKLQAATIFKMLNKVTVDIVDTDDVSRRDVYYNINKDKRYINQQLLLNDYLNEKGLLKEWNNIKSTYLTQKNDCNLFFKDFFATKFNFKEYKEDHLYELFVNYFETMLVYYRKNVLMKKLERSAKLYSDILNVTFDNKDIKDAIVKIKIHDGEDTFAYILNVYGDYVDNNISEATFIEILQTVDEYLINRQKNSSDITFNELINYLNAFITCK